MAPRPVPETTSKVVGEDWSLDDLTGRTSANVEFVRLDLAETTASGGLTFDECVFRDVGFNLAKYEGAAFVNCTFVGCAFFGATFIDCKFLGSTFDHRCTFDQMTVERGDWSFVSLPRADLHNAGFDGVRMRETDLGAANLRGAVLRGCDLASANLSNVVLDKCDLRGSDLSAVDPSDAGLAGAIITWEQAAVLASAMGLDVRPD